VPSPLALLDGGTVAVIGLASIAVVRILRRRTARADAARSAAVRRYSTLRLDEAMEAERVRTDALLHDSVLTTLLSASAAATPDAEALAARMAGNALRIISEQTSSALSDTLVPFAAAIAAAGPRLMPASELVDFHLADAAGVLVPEAVGEALVSATRQAVANSVKHAGPFAARIVRATPWGADGIRVTIRDDGRGFDVAAIPVERLGVRVSIVERVRRVGGHAEIRSAPGRGTTVVLTWPAAAAQRSEEAVPDRAAVPA
jgi:signal transduction histidine kinase